MPYIINARENLSGSTRLLYDELTVKNANPIILDASSNLIEYTDHAQKQRLLFSVLSEKSSAIGRIIAESKPRTDIMAEHLGIATPASAICRTIQDARAFLETHHTIVLKPLSQDSGRGVSTNITTDQELQSAYDYARQYGKRVIAQQHITGNDVRLLTIGGVFTSAVIRQPAYVTADGVSTIEQLITATNSSAPRNDPDFMSTLPIKMEAAQHYLTHKLQTIPPTGETVQVVGPANVSLGGSLHEATHLVPPAMIADAEHISQKIDLGICGVDMMWNQTTGSYYLIEINSAPGIDIHNDPFSGTESDCVQQYVRWLIAA